MYLRPIGRHVPSVLRLWAYGPNLVPIPHTLCVLMAHSPDVPIRHYVALWHMAHVR